MTYTNGNGNGGAKLSPLLSPLLTVVVLVIGLMIVSSRFVTASQLNDTIIRERDNLAQILSRHDDLEKEINQIKIDQGKISAKLDVLIQQEKK